jgi:hypothetical protein
MGKRELEKKPRSPRDLYATVDPDAVVPLKGLLGGVKFIEPCAGAGDLTRLLEGLPDAPECVGQYDIDPQAEGITQRNCLTLTDEELSGVDYLITNPPFAWHMLRPILDRFVMDNTCDDLRTLLLLPGDMAHNKRMSPYLDRCMYIYSIGRLSWFKDESGKWVKGVDNYCWYDFTNMGRVYTTFNGRK